MSLRRILTVAVIMCVCFALHGVAFCEPEAAVDTFPKVRLPEPKFEFGDIVEGQPILHDFVIQNKGSATLDIKKVKPG